MASHKGHAKYLILSHEGALKEAKAFVPVPWDHAKFSMEDNAVIAKVTKSDLERAPGFEKDEWTRFHEREWTKKIHSYYEPGETRECTGEKTREHEHVREHEHMEYRPGKCITQARRCAESNKARSKASGFFSLC
ncbi:MAG: hypothetical protein Kow0099_06470 [Candidatus Abyssubacteria bacterium]